MYLIPADRLHGSPLMSREPTVSKRKHRETGKKRNPYAEANKIRKHHPYEEWLKLRHKMDEADLRKKTETNLFLDILIRVMPTGQASKVSPTPPPPPTPQKMRHGTQTVVTSALVTATPPPQPNKEFNYERVEEEDDDEEDYNEDDDFLEDQPREYGRKNVGPVASPYLTPYVYKRRILDTQYGVRKDRDMFMIGDSPV